MRGLVRSVCNPPRPCRRFMGAFSRGLTCMYQAGLEAICSPEIPCNLAVSTIARHYQHTAGTLSTQSPNPVRVEPTSGFHRSPAIWTSDRLYRLDRFFVHQSLALTHARVPIAEAATAPPATWAPAHTVASPAPPAPALVKVANNDGAITLPIAPCMPAAADPVREDVLGFDVTCLKRNVVKVEQG